MFRHYPLTSIFGRIVFLTAFTVISASALAADPLQGFTGTWKGRGTVTVSGEQEAIRCQARYSPSSDRNALNINVNCASDSYHVNIVSAVVVQGDTFSGSWQETARQLSGDVTGRIPEPNTYQASLETVGGGLQISARSDGRRQSITITSQGSEIQGANIALKKTK